MFKLFEVLKSHKELPTAEELTVAAGSVPMPHKMEVQITSTLDEQSNSIWQAFEHQKAAARVSLSLVASLCSYHVTQEPWDQEKFEHLITEWVVACNQPFDEVEKPEFIKMMEYAHAFITIPSRKGIKMCVMQMDGKIVEEKKIMFQVCLSNLSQVLKSSLTVLDRTST